MRTESMSAMQQAAMDRCGETGEVVLTPQEPSSISEPPAYPDGDVVGPCICGSWPGGKCLRCPPQRDVVAIVKAGGYVSDVEWECADSAPSHHAASVHTLGPWEVSGTSVIAADGGTICSTATFARPNAEDEANAVLIAKAPDMFEALEAIEFALSQGMPAAMVLDENSPIRDCIRASLTNPTEVSR